MSWVLAILVVLVLGGVAAVAAGHGDPMSEPDPDTPFRLPAGELGAADVRGVRLGRALHGYRCDEVDALLERLARQLEEAEGRQGDTEPGEAQRPR